VLDEAERDLLPRRSSGGPLQLEPRFGQRMSKALDEAASSGARSRCRRRAAQVTPTVGFAGRAAAIAGRRSGGGSTRPDRLLVVETYQPIGRARACYAARGASRRSR
jgi:hypothetical protein